MLREDLMWKLGREEFVVDLGPPLGKLPDYHEFMEDDDKGVRILRLRSLPDRIERYVYTGPQVSFEFGTGLLGPEGHPDEYEVYLGISLPKGLSVMAGREIAKNIRDAFLAWPPDQLFYPGALPVKRVRFSMSRWDQYLPEMERDFP